MLASAAALVGPSAHALDQLHTFNFSQIGFSEGATVTGRFTGVDLDGNGILVHFPGQVVPQPIDLLELTDFSMQFSGNSLAPAFELTLDDLFGFVYQLGTSGIGDDPANDPNFGDIMEGIGAIGANYFYTSGQGPNGIIGGYVGGEITLDDLLNVDELALDSSPNLVLVAAVPEPATCAMLVGAALAMLGCRRAHAAVAGMKAASRFAASRG
jgi:hypothetical protein